MEIVKENILLPEGEFSVDVIKFNKNDKSTLSSIYTEWRTLSDKLKSMKGRGVNLPEVLSESTFCLSMNCVRVVSSIPSANTSWDCYDMDRKKRIQVKACSVLPDLTSFGPKSVWDEIYFMDFCKDEKWNGDYDIYFINNNLIYNQKVNKNETMKDHQLQDRRPRFSVYKDIIQKKNIEPIFSGNLHQ